MKANTVKVVRALRKARRAIVAAVAFPVVFFARKWLAVEVDEETIRVLTDFALSAAIYALWPAARAQDEADDAAGVE